MRRREGHPTTTRSGESPVAMIGVEAMNRSPDGDTS
jgi:hypothetical protein